MRPSVTRFVFVLFNYLIFYLLIVRNIVSGDGRILSCFPKSEFCGVQYISLLKTKRLNCISGTGDLISEYN